MEVFVLTEDCEDNGEHDFTILMTEDSALNAAKKEILSQLGDYHYNFDDASHDHHDIYVSIKKLIDSGDIRRAIREYNEIPDTLENYSEHTFINVRCRDVMTHDGTEYHCSDPCGKDENISNFVLKKVEKPCLLCKRMNDFDADICWCCGQKPFSE